MIQLEVCEGGRANEDNTRKKSKQRRWKKKGFLKVGRGETARTRTGSRTQSSRAVAPSQDAFVGPEHDGGVWYNPHQVGAESTVQ